MKKLLTALLAGLAFSSCVPSTPQARIAQNPQVFAALPKKDQRLVEQGQVARGMSPDAVMLAWGYPSRRFEGAKDTKRTERWDYASSLPVYTSTFYGGTGNPWNDSHFVNAEFSKALEAARGLLERAS